MIDLILYLLGSLFGFGLGILFGWVLSIPKDSPVFKNNSNSSNSTAYLDEDEWKECVKDCPYYYYNEPKKKYGKKKV